MIVDQERFYLLDAANRVHVRNVHAGLRGPEFAEFKSGVESGTV